MTYREKLKQDHPDWDDDKLQKHVLQDCPYEYGYEHTHLCSLCGHIEDACPVCWDREIPETELINKTETNNERERKQKWTRTLRTP